MTTNEPNNPKLKLAVARMLLELIKCLPIIGSQTGGYHYYWIKSGEHILESEWLYVVHLAEQTLSNFELSEYAMHIRRLVKEASEEEFKNGPYPIPDGVFYHATFNQRATALCKVKNIEVL